MFIISNQGPRATSSINSCTRHETAADSKEHIDRCPIRLHNRGDDRMKNKRMKIK